MDVYKKPGINGEPMEKGRAFYVFPWGTDPEYAVIAAARVSKNALCDMRVIPVWVDGVSLYLEPVKGTVKMIAATRKGR